MYKICLSLKTKATKIKELRFNRKTQGNRIKEEQNFKQTEEWEKEFVLKIKHKLSIIFIFMFFLLLWCSVNVKWRMVWLDFAKILPHFEEKRSVLLFIFSFFYLFEMRSILLVKRSQRSIEMRERKRPMSKNSDQVVNWTKIKC